MQWLPRRPQPRVIPVAMPRRRCSRNRAFRSRGLRCRFRGRWLEKFSRAAAERMVSCGAGAAAGDDFFCGRDGGSSRSFEWHDGRRGRRGATQERACAIGREIRRRILTATVRARRLRLRRPSRCKLKLWIWKITAGRFRRRVARTAATLVLHDRHKRTSLRRQMAVPSSAAARVPAPNQKSAQGAASNGAPDASCRCKTGRAADVEFAGDADQRFGFGRD